MIPRLHPRGTSFKGACSYVLHDAGRTTNDRVEWTLSRNLGSPDIRDAWFEMMRTWQARGLLKEAAGFDARGRDNWKPVLHYTLSWHADDKPSPEHMRQAAMESLKLLGLSEHEAIIASHTDKQHMHVHVVVNTVHPVTGMTAPLKFTKREFSLWAEAYEREHGIHCEERIKNNEERRRLAADREREALAVLIAAAERKPLPKKRPYVPVKHKAANRKQWFDRKEIIERMKSMRAELDAQAKAANDVLWTKHSRERDQLDDRTEAAVDKSRSEIKEQYRPKWRDLYRVQKKEERHVRKTGGRLLDRAAFVYANRERLGIAGRPLTVRQMLRLIGGQDRLTKRVAQVHEQERRSLGRQQRIESKQLTDAHWLRHRAEFGELRDRQAAERQAGRDASIAQRKGITFDHAKAALAAELEKVPVPERTIKRAPDPLPLDKAFDQAAGGMPPKVSRAEQIRRDMEAWRRKNEGKDHGREM